jgi:hypothetical protein
MAYSTVYSVLNHKSLVQVFQLRYLKHLATCPTHSRIQGYDWRRSNNNPSIRSPNFNAQATYFFGSSVDFKMHHLFYDFTQGQHLLFT